MSASTGSLGNRPYIEIDGIPFPLVEGSMMQRSPLNPFSPASQGGNSSRITDARLAVEVWDDFTSGLGQRDESSQQTNSFSEGNLDARVPGAVALPQAATLLGSLGWVAADAPVYVEAMRGGPNEPTLFVYSRTSAKASVYRNVAIAARPAETVRGFTPFNAAYYYIAYTGADTKVYKTLDAGGTWTTPYTATGKLWRGLAVVDNRMIAYNETDNQFLYSLDGVTWTLHSPGFIKNPGETLRMLFSWIAPGGARDTVYALTTQRILGFEDESVEWHEYYTFDGIFAPDYPYAHVFRRDQNVYMAPYDSTGTDATAAVMMFTPGTSDEIGPSKRFGLPDALVNGFFKLQGGAHWMYGFASGTQGGIFSFNEFQGWTMMFDPSTLGTATLIGGGYSAGKLWGVTSDGNLYQVPAPDRRSLPPVSGGSYSPATHYIRSSWTSHQQQNRWKIGAFFEVDFRLKDGTSGVPAGSAINFRYRVDNSNWVTLNISNPVDQDEVGSLLMWSIRGDQNTWPVRLLLPNKTVQLGVPYKRIQWEVSYSRGGDATQSPVLASVSLYYTFWTESHFAYQFNVDLSYESWSDYPQEYFGKYTREDLVDLLFGLNKQKGYHTFKYANASLEETIDAVDLLVAGREDVDMGGGIYAVTVRDVSGN